MRDPQVYGICPDTQDPFASILVVEGDGSLTAVVRSPFGEVLTAGFDTSGPAAACRLRCQQRPTLRLRPRGGRRADLQRRDIVGAPMRKVRAG